METTIKAWWIVDGNFRLLCHTKESVQGWITFIINRGGAPKIEVAQ